ncbi:MAG: glycosyltransferase family 4 protein [Nitrospirota bacterium]
MKKIIVLDMWASDSASRGPSKHWLYNKLAHDYEIEIVNPSPGIGDDIPLLVRTFNFSKKKWGTEFYRLKEHIGKTPAMFRRRSARFNKAVHRLDGRPDLFFQTGALFGPIESHGIPYISYHDQTVSMVERGYKGWLPDNFLEHRDEWYRLEKNFYQSMTKVVTYSAVTRDSLINDYLVDAERVTVIPTACKLPFPSREEILKPRKRQLLFVTTDFMRKGGDILLNAVPLIKSKFPDITVVIAGGSIPPSIRISGPAVTYVGALSQQDLMRYYLESEILVHPARYDAFPNVIKEAIACGLPVVASGVCGIPEMLDGERAGVLMRNISPAGLGDAVIGLLSNEMRYRQIQEHCLTLREKYSIDTVGGMFVKLFNEYLG